MFHIFFDLHADFLHSGIGECCCAFLVNFRQDWCSPFYLETILLCPTCVSSFRILVRFHSLLAAFSIFKLLGFSFQLFWISVFFRWFSLVLLCFWMVAGVVFCPVASSSPVLHELVPGYHYIMVCSVFV